MKQKNIKENCYVKYILFDNYRQRGMLEGYFTGILKPLRDACINAVHP
jgi:hypothetical protein